MQLRWPVLITLMVALAASGCHAVRQIPLVPAVSAGRPVVDEVPGRAILGYTTRDGVYHAYAGFAQRAPGDSIRFYPPDFWGSAGLAGPYPFAHPTFAAVPAFTLAREEVLSLTERRSKTLATVGLVTVCALVAFVAVVAASSSEFLAP